MSVWLAGEEAPLYHVVQFDDDSLWLGFSLPSHTFLTAKHHYFIGVNFFLWYKQLISWYCCSESSPRFVAHFLVLHLPYRVWKKAALKSSGLRRFKLIFFCESPGDLGRYANAVSANESFGFGSSLVNLEIKLKLEMEPQILGLW